MLDVAFYAIGFLIIWWSYIGYPAFLFRKGTKRKYTEQKTFGDFSIIVPVFNEKRFIGKKISNLLSLDYPKNRFRIIVVDGGSTDGSIRMIAKQKIRLIKANKGDKIRDVNFALRGIKTKYVLVTDADSVIPRNTLKRFNSILGDDKVGAVGAYTSPSKTIEEERSFWEKNNEIRLMESDYFSASSLTAACYAFRRDIIRRFPLDVIADDLFVTLKTLSGNLLVVYDKGTRALEKRAPTSLKEMMKHKIRKGHADIREIARFFSQRKDNRFWRVIYPTKMLQMLISPILLPIVLVMSLLYLIFSPVTLVIPLLIGLAGIAAGPELKNRDTGILTNIKLLLLMNIILLLVIFTYPFANKTSRYNKTN